MVVIILLASFFHFSIQEKITTKQKTHRQNSSNIRKIMACGSGGGGAHYAHVAVKSPKKRSREEE